jgi:class 3 adenylate cyclase
MPEERKLVTILFADVPESTALGEALDPEDVRALMGRYYDHARRIIAEHGGTLEKFIGDAVMAIFGLPQAHGNDAERALAAALALRAAVAADPLLAERLLLRIGVNTGEVVATRDASGGATSAGDFLVTGDAVNVAARLQQLANPGEILAGERTRGLAQAGFLFGEARSLLVKGKSRRLAVCPLVGPRAARELSRPPLVGRRRELAQLGLLRDAALEERHPQLVSLVAPAGTGKTRLLEEFLARLDPTEGWQVATARCLPYGQTLTYWPLRGLLDELLGARFSPERVAEVFSAGGHSDEDAARLAGLLLATLGVESEERAESSSIFNAWRLLVEALSHQAPRTIVFEDLHWASESLLDLVEHIMRPRTQAPLLIIATSRPELLDKRPTWGGGRRNFTALALEPLSEAQTRTLVGKLAKKLPVVTREQIVERSGGNPFFVIELTRALAARVADPASAETDALPDTVHEAVQERLDLLSTREREVLQTAAVAGRAFRPAALQAALEALAPSEIDTALDGLLARDLIAPAEGDAYTFRHILIRDVAYGAISRSERVRMHLAVAAWLEQFASGRLDEFVELIAYHYREALLLARQSAVPLNVPVDVARAVHYLERAGELASRAGAFAEARSHLQSAIKIAPGAERPRLFEKLGDCLAISDVSLAAYREALQHWRAEAAPDPLAGARLLRKLLGVIMRWQGSLSERPSIEEVAALRTEARRLAESAGDEYEFWRLRTVELFWPFWSGEVEPQSTRTQMAVGSEAAAYFETRGDWAAFSEALDGYHSLAREIGLNEDALAASRRRLDAPGLSAYEHSDALAMVVWGHVDRGDYDRALEVAWSAIARRKTGEPATNFGHAAAWASYAACLSGRWSKVAEFLAIVDEAWEQWQRQGGFVFVRPGYVAALHVAQAWQDRAALGRAAAAADRLLLSVGVHDERGLVAAYQQNDPTLLNLSADITVLSENMIALVIMFLSERGRPTPRALLDRVAARPETRYIDVLRRATGIAEALAAGDEARLAKAIEDAEAHHLVPHAARMRIVLAQRTSVGAHLDRARPVLEQLGDRQFLRRLEEVEVALR